MGTLLMQASRRLEVKGLFNVRNFEHPAEAELGY